MSVKTLTRLDTITAEVAKAREKLDASQTKLKEARERLAKLLEVQAIATRFLGYREHNRIMAKRSTT